MSKTSAQNPILEAFRTTADSLVWGPDQLPREASWWLTLMVQDPQMDRADYWGDLVDEEITNDDIAHAWLVLSRIRNVMGE